MDTECLPRQRTIQPESERDTSTETLQSTRDMEDKCVQTDLNQQVSSREDVGVFFSYCSKDRDWVENMVGELERNHGISCLFDVRDFRGGPPAVDNIIDSIHRSRKVVLVISSAFLGSPWCAYETQLALYDHLNRERKGVIPILIEECIVPDSISYLTYLDAREMEFRGKFVDALKSDDAENPWSFTIHNNKLVKHMQDQENGKFLFDSNWSDEKKIVATLRYNKIKISAATVVKAVEEMQNANIRIIVIPTIVMVTLWVIIVLCSSLLTEIGSYDMFKEWAEHIMIVENILRRLPAITCYLWIAVILIVLKFLPRWRKCEATVNSLFMEYCVIIEIITTNRLFILPYPDTIPFFYFNAEGCKGTVEQYLLKRECYKNRNESTKEELSCGNEIEEPNPNPQKISEIKALAKEYVAQCAGSFVRKVRTGEMQNPSRQRHTKEGMCLCQLVESEIFNEEV
ncbi:uncharacterized protein LOC144444588 [Glandiceps talaboti]